MTLVGRLEVDHPSLGDTEGVGLHSQQESNFAKLSDNIGGRYSVFTSEANGATIVVTHNLGVNLSELEVFIYSGSHPSLVAINDPTNATVPWAIAETGGSETVSLDITAPASGGPFTGAIFVVHAKGAEVKAAKTNRAVSAAATLSNRRIHLADSTGAAFTLTLPAPDADLYIPIKDVGGDAANNLITIATPGAETIDGAASFDIDANYQAVIVVSDGTNYFIV